MTSISELPARRALKDLFVRGKEVTIDDGEGPVVIWAQKLNPVDYATASRKAHAARAIVLAAQHDHSSDEYLNIQSFIDTMDRPAKEAQLVLDEQIKVYPVVVGELGSEGTWKDGYLDGLRDAWSEGMEKRFINDPADVEAKRVHDELDKFIAEVDAHVERELEGHRLGLKAMSDSALDKSLAALLFKSVSDRTWTDEYQKCEIWLGCRWGDDHSERVFAEREDVNELQPETLQALSDALREVTADPIVGKG